MLWIINNNNSVYLLILDKYENRITYKIKVTNPYVSYINYVTNNKNIIKWLRSNGGRFLFDPAIGHQKVCAS